MAKFACIGGRDVFPIVLENCEKLGYWIARCGGELHSGNAEGSDEAYARGANRVDPTLVHLHLPWNSFNPGFIVPGNNVISPPTDASSVEIARAHHKKWDSLKQGAQRLHRRNVGIVRPGVDPLELVDMCIAAPSTKKAWGGGTAMGMKIAVSLNIELVNINNWSAPMLDQLCERIRTLCSIPAQ